MGACGWEDGRKQTDGEDGKVTGKKELVQETKGCHLYDNPGPNGKLPLRVFLFFIAE